MPMPAPLRFAACGLLTLLCLAAGGCAEPEAPEAPPPTDGARSADTLAAPAPAPHGSTEVPLGAPALAGTYVGVTYPPVPDGVEQRGGALAVGPGADAAEAQYAYVDVVTPQGRQLWLGRLQGRDADGEATWRVVDADSVTVGDGEQLLIHGCTAGDRAGMAAVMREASTDTLTEARAAWGVDRTAGRLERVSTADVRCLNEGVRAP